MAGGSTPTKLLKRFVEVLHYNAYSDTQLMVRLQNDINDGDVVTYEKLEVIQKALGTSTGKKYHLPHKHVLS